MLNLTPRFSDLLKKGESHNWRYIVKIEQEAGDHVNMMGNPGFETAGGGDADVFGTWVEGTNNGIVSKETTLVHSGGAACKLTMGDDAGEWAAVRNTITVVAETAYIVTFYTRGDGSSTGNHAVWDLTGSQNIIAETTNGVTGTQWVKIPLSFTTPVNCVSLRVSGVINWQTVDTPCYFDDFHMQPDSDYYYYSGQRFSIVDLTSDDLVLPYLSNKDIPITQLLNYREHKASIGGFSIQLIDEGVNDAWASNPIYNRRIWLYLGTDDLDYLDDSLLLYTGICKNWTTKDNIITLNIENSSLVSQKEIPALLSSSDAAAGEGGILPEDSQGLTKPLVYGDHRYYYMNDTEGDMTYDRSSNLTPCRYLGLDQDGDERWLVADHQVESITGGNQEIWGFDSALGRMVELETYVVEQNTSSGCIISFSVNPYFLDYWLPDGSIDNETETDESGGTATVTDPTDACDLDPDTEAEIFVENGDGATGNPVGSFDVDFKTYKNPGTINAVKVFAKANFLDPQTSGFTEALINAEDASGASDTFAQYGTEAATEAGAGLSVTCILEGIDEDNTANTHTLEVHEIHKVIQYKPTSRLPIFAGVQGREFSGTWNSRKTTGNLVEHPTDVIESIVRDELSLGDDNIDMTAVDAVNTELADWKFSGYIGERQNTKDIIEDLARQCASFVFWGAEDKVKMDTFYAANTTNRTIGKGEVIGVPKVSKSNLSDLVNSLTHLYNEEPGEGRLTKVISRVDDRTTTGSQDIHNAVMTRDIETNFINDATVAGKFSDHWCKDDADSFWSVLRDVVEVNVATNRGIGFWDTTFKPLLLLELLDIFELDDAHFDDIVKCNGASWDGKQFKIFWIKRRKLGMQIKGFSV